MNTWSFLEYWRLFGTKDKRVEAHHDLRDSLHSLLGLTEILSQTELSKDQQELVLGIQHAGRLIQGAVDQYEPGDGGGLPPRF